MYIVQNIIPFRNSNGSSNYYALPPPRYLIWLTNWDACLLGAAILLDTCLVLFMAGGRSEMCWKLMSLLLDFGLGLILIDGFDVMDIGLFFPEMCLSNFYTAVGFSQLLFTGFD